MGLHVVLRHALAVCVPVPEVVLRAGVPLLSRQPVPARCFDIVLRHPYAGVVHLVDVLTPIARSSMPVRGRFNGDGIPVIR